MFKDIKISMVTSPGRSWDSIRNMLIENSKQKDTTKNKRQIHEGTLLRREMMETQSTPKWSQ